MDRYVTVNVEVVKLTERAALLRFEINGDPEWVPLSAIDGAVGKPDGTWTNVEIAEWKLRELGLA